MPSPKVAFQGELGAFSHSAALAVYPKGEVIPCTTFSDTILAVQESQADLAIVPIENSLYGRITDIHHLLPESGLYIVGEHFEPIAMNLLGVPGARLEDVTSAQSLSVALGQCRRFIQTQKLQTLHALDTAGSAREVAQNANPKIAAIASKLAAEIYGLDILAENIEDASHNTTRFLALSREHIVAAQNEVASRVKTTFVFRVRNVPAALYKTMGGFATNGVNMTKLESYMTDGSFTATQFYADIEGHPEAPSVKLAFEELEFFTSYFKILGVYEASPRKKTQPTISE